MTEQITLNEYEEAERQLFAVEARRGLLVHLAITVAVSAALIIINVVVAPQFPWSPFPVVGMSIGVIFHYVYGVRRLTPAVQARQQAIERRAADLRSVRSSSSGPVPA